MNQSLCSDSVQVPYCISEDSKIISVACAEPKSLQWKCPGALLHLWGQQNDFSCLGVNQSPKEDLLNENSQIISAASENALPQPTEIIFAVLCKVQISKCMGFLTCHSFLSSLCEQLKSFCCPFLRPVGQTFSFEMVHPDQLKFIYCSLWDAVSYLAISLQSLWFIPSS